MGTSWSHNKQKVHTSTWHMTQCRCHSIVAGSYSVLEHIVADKLAISLLTFNRGAIVLVSTIFTANSTRLLDSTYKLSLLPLLDRVMHRPALFRGRYLCHHSILTIPTLSHRFQSFESPLKMIDAKSQKICLLNTPHNPY